MKELKMGDLVEIRTVGSWGERIFIKHGFNGIVVVHPKDRGRYCNGYGFVSNFFSGGQWRRIKEKTYRPFTWEERDQLCGKWIKHKDDDNSIYMIIQIEKDGIYTGDFYRDYKELLEWFFCDIEGETGLPVGVEE
jgi:hypothetical protein